MQNGNNLPKLIKYSNNIKDVTITKFPGIDTSKFGDCYFVEFTELIDKEEEQKNFFGFKKKIKTQIEQHRTLPFTFKSLDVAKDFAQYIPNLKLEGQRLYKIFNKKRKSGKNLILYYETYQLAPIQSDFIIYLKFTYPCEHRKAYNKRDNNCYPFYINDLDKIFYGGEQGNWYCDEELIVDGFFTKYEFARNDSNVTKSEIIPDMLFEKIGDIIKIENENTHKFILVEETKQ